MAKSSPERSRPFRPAAYITAAALAITSSGEVAASAQAAVESYPKTAAGELMHQTDSAIMEMCQHMRLAAKHKSGSITEQPVIYGGQRSELLVAVEKVTKNGTTFYDEFVCYTRIGEKFPFLTILIEGSQTPTYEIGQRFEVGMFLYPTNKQSNTEKYDAHLVRMNPDGSADFGEFKLNAGDSQTSQRYQKAEPYLVAFMDVASRIVGGGKTTHKPPA